ncbi:MAG TPA: STAS domain-containing protein [Streptosporangiaceae bacterium]|nr:STAS domain-containing protein [Streptosporangiaceae bacterium]
MTGGESRLRALRRETSSLMPGRAGRPHPVPGPALTLDVQRRPGYAVVIAAGEIDIATAEQLEERLSAALAAAGHRLVADLSQVSFIDAAGLRVLDRTARQAAEHGTSLHVVCDRPQILRLFELFGLDRRVQTARTREEAVQALRDAHLAALP